MVGKPELIHFTTIRHHGCCPLRSSRSLLAATLTLLSGGFQLAVAFRVDVLLTPRQHVLRRDVAGGTVQADELCPGLLETRFYAAEGIPAYAYGPGLLSVAHGPNEYVDLRKVIDSATIYALTAVDLLRT